MKIILKSLELSNFKGRTGKWEFAEGKNVFLGENGAGKTRLCDAERWVKDGKNSLGQSKFDIKTIVDGQACSKMEHGVIGVYDIGGEELTLERVYAEKWTKTRGNPEAEFSGHTTTYRVDNKANTSKRAFDAKVHEVFGGENFQLASDPVYFAGLSGEKRREILTSMAGGIDEDKIIDAIPDLRQMLNGLSVEEKRAISTQDKRKINEELKTLPARIDEHKRTISKVTDGISLEDAQKKVAESRGSIKSAKKAIEDFRTGANSGVAEQLKKLNQELRDAVSAFEKEKNAAHRLFTVQTRRLEGIADEIKQKNVIAKKNTEQIEQLKQSWRTVSATRFEEKGNSCNYCGEIIVCPHCDEKDEDAQGQFNKNKSVELQKIVDNGNGRVDSGKLIKQKIAELEKEKEEIGAVEEPKILSLAENKSMAALRGTIETLEENKPAAVLPVKLVLTLEKTEKELESALESSAMSKSNFESERRIEELEKRMKILSATFNQIEKFLFLLDEYNKNLAEATENPVNDLFEYARFRMFTTQINGAVIPACDILNDEYRPYETALSAGEKIRVGLDMIKTFQPHFKIWAPVFIDGAESVTNIPELDCQTIELRASVEHKELTQV